MLPLVAAVLGSLFVLILLRRKLRRAPAPTTPEAHHDVAALERRFREGVRFVAEGELDTGFDLVTEVLAFARDTGNLVLSGACLSIMADVHRQRGDFHAAERCDAASLADARLAAPDQAVLAISVAGAGETARLRGDIDGSERRYREALQLIGTDSEHPLYLTVIERLAEYEFRRGRFPQAKRLQSRALELHEAQGTLAQVIGTLRNLGLCDRELGNFAEARECFKRCHDQACAGGDWLTAHIALAEEGITCAAAGDHESAVAALRQSLEVQEAHRLVQSGTVARIALCRSLLAVNKPLEALSEIETALVYPTHRRSADDDFIRANCYVRAGQLQKAIEVLEELLQTSRREHDTLAEAACLGHLGYLNRKLGNAGVARGFFEQARDLHHRQGDADGEAEDVRQLAALDGRPIADSGLDNPPGERFDFWQALLASPNAEEKLAAMLRDARTKEDAFSEFNALDGLGVVARNKGNLEEAIRWHQQALQAAGVLKGIRGVAPKVVGNNNLAIVFRMLGDFERARICYQTAIASARETLGADNPLELLPRANLAKLYLLNRDVDAAKQVYLDEPRMIISNTDALMDLEVRIWISQELNDTASLLPALNELVEKCSAAGLIDREAVAFKQLGHAHYSRGDLTVAVGFYDRALTLLGSRDVYRRERADILYFRSLARLGQQDHAGAYSDAAASLRESASLVEQRSSEGFKRLARISDVERYSHAAMICGSLDRIPEAMEYLELSRSRLLSTFLSTSKIEPNQSVPQELAGRLRSIQAERRRLDLLSVQEQEMPTSPHRLGELSDRMISLHSDWQDTLEQVARYDPLFEQFRDAPIRYEEIEALIPRDKRTALLELCVTGKRAQAILVSPGSLQRAYTFERLSGERLHRLLNDQWFEPLRRLRLEVAEGTQVDDLESMNAVLRELYEEIFGQRAGDGESIAACLARCEVKRLIVIPHGLLHLVPIHALWYQTGARRRYLIDDFEIVCAPSSGVLRHCIQNSAGHRPSEHLVAFADPDGSLRGARNEVEAIKRCFSAATVREGSDATVDAAVQYGREADVLHFACHGRFDSESPLSSYLEMADGRLTLSRIFEDLRMKPGAIVTLSACETGMVFPDRTDEYLGLPSGFLFAGSGCVIGSLWPVDDSCTATLMEQTYADIFRSGESPAASLRAAQRSLKAQDAYSHPYYWAPFQVIGSGWLSRRRRIER